MRYMVGFTASCLALFLGGWLLESSSSTEVEASGIPVVEHSTLDLVMSAFKSNRFDSVASGVYQPRAVYYNGVDDDGILRFTFDIQGESFTEMEPLKVLPVDDKIEPHILVFIEGEQSTFGLNFKDGKAEVTFFCGVTEADLKKPGKRSFWVIAPKAKHWVTGLPDKYVLPVRGSKG